MALIPTPTPSRFPPELWDRFSSREGFSFDFAMDDERLDWWERTYGKRRIYPEMLAKALFDGIPFQGTTRCTLLDIEKEHLRIECEFHEADGNRVLKGGRSIELDERQIHLNKLFVTPAFQQRGFGAVLLGNAYRLARHLGLEKLALSAVDHGTYAWARAGFIPLQEVWDDPKESPRNDITRYLEDPALSSVDWRLRNVVHKLMEKDDPKTIWAVSALRTPVISRLQPGKPVTFGFAVLAESGASWKGHLPFEDEEAKDRLEAYLTEKAATAI